MLTALRAVTFPAKHRCVVALERECRLLNPSTVLNVSVPREGDGESALF